MDPGALLAALALGDGALPIGRFAHSGGLEALLAADPDLDEDGLVEVVGSVVACGAGTLDAVALVHACRADALAELLALDAWLTARRLGEPAWRASTSQGRQLAALAPSLAGGDVALSFCAAIGRGESDGNLPVVEGALAGSRGVPADAAALVALRGTASAHLAVAVRLGRLSARRSQAALRRLEPTIAGAAARAAATDLADATSSAVELELAALLHGRADGKLFIT